MAAKQSLVSINPGEVPCGTAGAAPPVHLCGDGAGPLVRQADAQAGGPKADCAWLMERPVNAVPG